MARARNIKPGFFSNDDLADISPLGRLLFIGLWTIADKAGRMEDRPRRIKAEVLPYDDCDVDGLLNDLEKHGFITRYEHDNSKYIQVLNFTKHQNPHVKESESQIPAPDQHSASTVQVQCNEQPKPEQAGLIPDSGFPITDSIEKEKVKKENPDASPSAQPAPKKSSGTTGTRLPENFQVPDDWIDWATDERPDIPPADMRTVAESFVDYWTAKAGAAARKVDWQATWRNWIRNQKRYATPPPAKQQKFDPTAYVNRNRVPSHDIIDI